MTELNRSHWESVPIRPVRQNRTCHQPDAQSAVGLHVRQNMGLFFKFLFFMPLKHPEFTAGWKWKKKRLNTFSALHTWLMVSASDCRRWTAFVWFFFNGARGRLCVYCHACRGWFDSFFERVWAWSRRHGAPCVLNAVTCLFASSLNIHSFLSSFLGWIWMRRGSRCMFSRLISLLPPCTNTFCTPRFGFSSWSWCRLYTLRAFLWCQNDELRQ